MDVSKNPDGPIELYDLSTDIGEKKNVSDRHPEIVKEMAEIMKEARIPNKEFKLLPSEQSEK